MLAAATDHAGFSEQTKGFRNMTHLHMETSRVCTKWDVCEIESSRWFLSSSAAGTSTEDLVCDKPSH
jgi:hypothetical protein